MKNTFTMEGTSGTCFQSVLTVLNVMDLNMASLYLEAFTLYVKSWQVPVGSLINEAGQEYRELAGTV